MNILQAQTEGKRTQNKGVGREKEPVSTLVSLNLKLQIIIVISIIININLNEVIKASYKYWISITQMEVWD